MGGYTGRLFTYRIWYNFRLAIAIRVPENVILSLKVRFCRSHSQDMISAEERALRLALTSNLLNSSAVVNGPTVSAVTSTLTIIARCGFVMVGSGLIVADCTCRFCRCRHIIVKAPFRCAYIDGAI